MRSELRSVSVKEGGIEQEEAEFLVHFSAQSYITYVAWVQLIDVPKQCRADTKKPHLSAKMVLLNQIKVDLFQFRPVAERRNVAVYCRDGSFSLKSIIHMKAIKKYYFMAIVFSLGLRAKLLHEARPFIFDFREGGRTLSILETQNY